MILTVDASKKPSRETWPWMLLDPPGEGCCTIVWHVQSCNSPCVLQTSTSAVTYASSCSDTWIVRSENNCIPCFHCAALSWRWWQPFLGSCPSAQQHVQAAGCELAPITSCPALPITCQQTADIRLYSLSAYKDRPDEVDAALTRYNRLHCFALNHIRSGAVWQLQTQKP